jgi:hypothetical protein
MLRSLHLSGEGLGMGAPCAFAPLRASRETKKGLLVGNSRLPMLVFSPNSKEVDYILNGLKL